MGAFRGGATERRADHLLKTARWAVSGQVVRHTTERSCRTRLSSGRRGTATGSRSMQVAGRITAYRLAVAISRRGGHQGAPANHRARVPPGFGCSVPVAFGGPDVSQGLASGPSSLSFGHRGLVPSANAPCGAAGTTALTPFRKGVPLRPGSGKPEWSKKLRLPSRTETDCKRGRRCYRRRCVSPRARDTRQ